MLDFCKTMRNSYYKLRWGGGGALYIFGILISWGWDVGLF